MPAGTELHRGIQQGFQESCAAVFFITPNFKDESHLRNEINYALQEKIKKADLFKIITLCLKNEVGERGEVPPTLHSYVWKMPNSDLEVLDEILKALPISVGPVRWSDQTPTPINDLEHINGYVLPVGSRDILRKLYNHTFFILPVSEPEKREIFEALENQSLLGVLRIKGNRQYTLSPKGVHLCEQIFGERPKFP